MSENGDDVNSKTATLKVETALINDIDLDHIETLPKRRGSCTSTRSWSSGKTRRAPPPPPPLPARDPPEDNHQEAPSGHDTDASDDESNYSQDSYTVYYRSASAGDVHHGEEFRHGKGSRGNYKERAKLFAQDQWADFRMDRRKQRTCAMWSCFLVFVVTVVASMSAFLTSFGGPMKRDVVSTTLPERIVDSSDRRWKDNIQASSDASRNYSHLDRKKFDVMLIMGGRGQQTVEVMTSRGSCNLPESYPSPMPVVLTGSMAVHSKSGKVVTCGGLTTNRVLNSYCYQYDLASNSWSQLTRLRWNAAFGAAVVTASNQMVITGGNNAGHITPSTQILDLNRNHWSLGPELPYGMWGHCSVLLPNGDLVVLGGWPDKVNSRVSKYDSMQAVFVAPSIAAAGNQGFHAAGKSTWYPLPKMSQGRATHACMITKYKNSKTAIMVAGGLGSTDEALRSVEILELTDFSYRPLFDKWHMLSRMNVARAWYPSLGILNKKLFIAGGRERNVDLATVESYGKSSWEVKESGSMRVGRSGGNAVTFKTDRTTAMFIKNCFR